MTSLLHITNLYWHWHWHYHYTNSESWRHWKCETRAYQEVEMILHCERFWTIVNPIKVNLNSLPFCGKYTSNKGIQSWEIQQSKRDRVRRKTSSNIIIMSANNLSCPRHASQTLLFTAILGRWFRQNLTKVLIKTLKASTLTRSALASVASTSLLLGMACNDLEPSPSVVCTYI